MNAMPDNVNAGAFEAILDNQFDVTLPSKKVTLRCRPLPFATLSDTIARVIFSTRSEAVSARNKINEALQKVREEGDELTDETASNFMKLAGPAFTGMIVAVPEVLTKVLKDVIVGATEDVVRALSATDCVAIVSEVFAREDVDILAKHLRVFFVKAMALTKEVRGVQEDGEEEPQTEESSQPNS